ncbi:MAG: bifunctional phosphopantothenoylcysteine decarboxylase/phosphopantothenate--cysteine ligase CoaBC [Thermoleophilia bacterium]
MPRVILGVTGGIAAYKACELLRLLVQDGHEVTPVLTDEADAFVARRTFAALARRESPDELYPHLTRADLLVVAPLSANTLAKLANGLADNVLTQLALAFAGPVLLAPAMNTRMWEHPATQANLATLVARGAHVVGPEVGELAEGEVGAGRMSEPEAIHARVRELLAAGGALAGRTVLVTAGGTREPIDAVRFVGNRSSGRMGAALARQAALRGAEVTLLASNLAVEPPAGVEVVQAPTAADLARETFARAPGADLVLMAAAVADYRPATTREDKRKKGDARWTIELEATQDILAELGRSRRDGQVLVGFAADVGEPGLEDARRKLERKAVNLIVFNDVSRKDIGFEAGDNEVTIIGHDCERTVAKAGKDAVAAAILDEATAILERA